MHTYIHELAHHLRTQLEYVNEQQLKITDYESYIENWVHEIKKPLSLMTLLLDNRKDEMSPLVHTRMLYVRDHTRQNVEQILYFSRLGAVHKDYYFEPLPILKLARKQSRTIYLCSKKPIFQSHILETTAPQFLIKRLHVYLGADYQ